MEPNLTPHYLAITTDSARRSRRAEHGWLIEQAIATQPKRTRTLAVRRRVGVVLSAMISHRPHAIRQLLTHIHSARPSAQR